MWTSEVIFDSEVHFVSEVSPDGEVQGKLNFTFANANPYLRKLHNSASVNNQLDYLYSSQKEKYFMKNPKIYKI